MIIKGFNVDCNMIILSNPRRHVIVSDVIQYVLDNPDEFTSAQKPKAVFSGVAIAKVTYNTPPNHGFETKLEAVFNKYNLYLEASDWSCESRELYYYPPMEDRIAQLNKGADLTAPNPTDQVVSLLKEIRDNTRTNTNWTGPATFEEGDQDESHLA